MIKKILFGIGCIFFLPHLAWGVSDEFTIKTLVGGDTTAPTTPTMLTADPIATDQIDVTWSTSVDNFLLSGYVLLRDGTPIATTTLTSFSDTGLVAGTLYSYEVYAFDSSDNVSTTSNALSTTTLDIVVPPTVATSTPPVRDSQSTKVDSLGDFNIVTTVNTATISWETNRPTKYTLRWGRSDFFEGGYIVNDTYEEKHTSSITDLEPGTLYVYELISITPGGVIRPLQTGQFKTKEAKITTLPPNVELLEAIVEGEDVRLNWRLPTNVPDIRVRIVRNYLGYPTDPYNGAVVYEGSGVTLFDKGSLSQHSPQYYSVFVIDSENNVSSGAVIKVYKNNQDIIVQNNNYPSIFEVNPTASSTADQSVTVDKGYFEVEDKVITEFGFDSSNIQIKQNDNLYTFLDSEISLFKNEPFTISIPYTSLPKHLKSIVVTMLDPTNHKRSFSFLLRINKDRTAYEATIAPLGVVGVSRLQVEIFDFERKIVGLYRKQITFSNSAVSPHEVIFPDKIVNSASKAGLILFYGILLLLIIWLLFFWKRRKRKTEDNR